MNLFRRSSTGGEDGHHSLRGSFSEGTAVPASTNTGGGGGGLKNSFCRVFLPRSRTTSSCNLDRPVTASPVASASQSGTTAAPSVGGQPQQHHGKYSASTEWSYLGQKHKRTASLSRNLTRRSRSVTMPNIEAGAQPPFSTFHGNNGGGGGGNTGLSIPPKPPRKTNNKPQQQPEVSKNDLSLGSSSPGSLKTIPKSLSSSLHSSSYISPYGTISHQHSRPPSQLRVSLT